MEKLCMECGERLIGRSDKKFCEDACRNSFNNRYNKDHTNLMRNTHNKLRKNWRILNGLNPKQKAKASKQVMERKGFDFTHITSLYTTKVGTVYYFVYDQGYLPLENNYFALVKRDL